MQVTITNREEETIKNWYLAVTLPAAANISRTYSFNHGNQTHLGKREKACSVWSLGCWDGERGVETWDSFRKMKELVFYC